MGVGGVKVLFLGCVCVGGSLVVAEGLGGCLLWLFEKEEATSDGVAYGVDCLVFAIGF